MIPIKKEFEWLKEEYPNYKNLLERVEKEDINFILNEYPVMKYKQLNSEDKIKLPISIYNSIYYVLNKVGVEEIHKFFDTYEAVDCEIYYYPQ